MLADPVFFRDLAYVFGAAMLGGALAWMTRQPLVLGYVLGGIIIGPFTPGPTVGDLHAFELFAEVGVMLLMFSIGIEFSLRDLLRVKWVALVGGPLGIVLTVLAGAGLGHLVGMTAMQGVVIGAVVSVASTMVLARLLIDRGELHSPHGRVLIGVSLVEDLAVVVLIALLPAFGEIDRRLTTILTGLGLAAVVLVPFGVLAARVMPWLLVRAARTRNEELFLLLTLALGLGAAALTQAVGLSHALGAFLAGLLISNSDYAHETLARLLPMRDAFVALFFVTIGALMDPNAVVANLPLLVLMLLLIIPGKFVIRAGISWLFGYPLSTALHVGLGLSQIGEFSFVLVQVARSAGHVGDDVYNATLAAALLSILVNGVLVRYAGAWIDRLPAMAPSLPPDPAPTTARRHVIICGFGRVGSAVGEALDTFDIPYRVIERDPDVVRALRLRGVPALFGDTAHRDLLLRAGVSTASLVVIAVPEAQSVRLGVRVSRALRPDVPIFARTHEGREVARLREYGATEVIQPEVEAGATLIRHTLARLSLPKEAALEYLSRFRTMDVEDRTPPPDDVLPEVREITLPAGLLTDQSLREARIRERFGVTVVAIHRANGPTVVNPPPETMVRAGDRLRVFGLHEQIDFFVETAARAE
jgi:CPA2 family monovalent cation:H+ antiporter-2